MGTESDPRADALARLADAQVRLTGLAGEVALLKDELAGVRASIEVLPVAAPVVEPAPVAAAGSGDISGARLVALDMVTSGVPRDEAVLRLAADFPGVDVATLLDEAATSRG